MFEKTYLPPAAIDSGIQSYLTNRFTSQSVSTHQQEWVEVRGINRQEVVAGIVATSVSERLIGDVLKMLEKPFKLQLIFTLLKTLLCCSS